MRILILGATGRTGKHLLEQALQRGYHVHVLVRIKNKLPLDHGHLTVFEGSPSDPGALDNAMNGCEAVLSALNISRYNDFPWTKLRTPVDFLSSVMKSIIELMATHGIKRIIFTSAWGVAETRKDIPGWFRWFIEHSNIRYPYDDHARQEDLLKQTSLHWTAVRAVGLTNSDNNKEVMVSLNNNPEPKLLISRSHVATFMLDALEKNLYMGEMPVVWEK
jgi:uncharacterized protein YbjT (DUF2867 family)